MSDKKARRRDWLRNLNNRNRTGGRAIDGLTPLEVTRRGWLAGAGALAIAGCHPAARADLRFWATSYEGDYSPHLTAAFERATGLSVDVQSVPSTAAHEKMLTAFAGGALPDVFMVPSGWVREFWSIGAIAPVPSPALIADTVPTALALARVDGRDVAVPWAIAPQVQYYRRDLLAAAGYAGPPDDWEAWRAMGRTLKRRRPDDYVFLMLLNWPDTLVSMLWQSGARLLREDDTRGNFSQPAAEAAFAFYKSLFDEGLAPRALSTEVQDPLAALAAGYFAIWPSWPTLLLDLRRRAAELPRERWGVARLAGPTGPSVASMVSASLCVSATTPRPREAWALVRHLTSRSSEVKFQQMIGNLPARASAWNALSLDPQVLAPFAAQLAAPGLAPPVIEWERIQIEIQYAAERVVRGLQTIRQALAGLDARADQLLAKRRELVQAGQIA
ncbi:extracellular solute-binding protein [Sphingomonas guangdongensis]|uniref:extracellular solute-binding protein n=1 Tax=Sphingomonas guangdongensis TaxID=1141890 RepID=UPI0015CAE685|nr:extracellular solute-binding protein [Sphingomonas guangdongensis]